MAKKGSDQSFEDIPHVRKEPRPDFGKVEDKPLPEDLQKLVDKESIFDEIYDGSAPASTDSSLRYAAYATRFRTILISAQRYVAYTSDIGESFRPVAHPYLVKGAYGVSWAYLIGDVSHEGYKAYHRNQRILNPGLAAATAQEKVQKSEGLPKADVNTAVAPTAAQELHPGTISPLDDYRTVMIQRGVFQSIASMGLPAFTIHSIVRYSGRALKDAKNKTIRSYGPIGLGLAAVPFLPFVFDKPVEEAVEWTFHKAFAMYDGKGAAERNSELSTKKELAMTPSYCELDPDGDLLLILDRRNERHEDVSRDAEEAGKMVEDEDVESEDEKDITPVEASEVSRDEDAGTSSFAHHTGFGLII
ncbi:MAG: hypothetical protein M1837_005243 [Sclerophora amabilis]|nr:MAG: hypothetical protein M1837_005243 [Sclerophora amabilis]